MKIFGILFLLTILFSAAEVGAQDLTIILFRHAEKDVSTSLNNNDPHLTAVGKQRAENLFEVLRKYKPSWIFSTARARTRETVLPLATKLDDKYRLQIQIYDAQKLEDFAEKLLAIKRGTVAVAGHSDSIPQLANLLIRQEKYKELDENEYDKIWIIRIKKNTKKSYRAEDRVITY